jgi:glutathione S-transferase
MEPRPYLFYAAEISYFSGKVRPALRYKGVHFRELLPDFQNVILPRTGLAFIPVVVTPDDETWQDTSDILDALERRVPDPPLYPTTPLQRLVAFLIELYADEFLILPAMHYRWDFPESVQKARAEFIANSETPETAGRFADRMSGALPFLGVTPATAPAIEAHTRELLAVLSEHLATHAYVLGDRMSLADCALMGPLYAHLYLDAVPGRLLRETAPRVCRWIERMNRPDPAAPGEWLPDDALAPTLRPLLELIGRDAVPLILDAARAFDTWADGQVPEEPPRAVGGHETRLRGVTVQRYTSSYTPWMVQRPLDVHRSFTPEQRRTVERALAGTGCDALLAHAPRRRVAKRRFKIVLEG